MTDYKPTINMPLWNGETRQASEVWTLRKGLRVASCHLITEAQAQDLRASGIDPIVKNDGRFKQGRGEHLAYEAEALGQAAIEQLLRDRLDALLPEPLDRVRVRERRQQTAVLRSLTKMKGGA